MSTDLKDTNGTDRRRELRAELARRIDRFVGSNGPVRPTDVPGLTLVRRTRLERPACYTYEPSVALIAQGKKRVDLGQRTFVYDESRHLLTSLDLPIASQLLEASEDRPFLALVLKLELPVVRDLLSREEIEVAKAPPNGPAMATGENSPELLAAFCRLVDLIGAQEDIPVVSPLIQREITYRILRGPAGGRLGEIASSGDQSNQTARAIAWIRSHYSEPLRVEDLARIAGMGLSTFHRHFRDLTTMSPLQYQKQLRLQNARGRMLTEGVDAATAAFEVGYESASQFTREYSRLFGQPPMRDIQSLRS